MEIGETPERDDLFISGQNTAANSNVKLDQQQQQPRLSGVHQNHLNSEMNIDNGSYMKFEGDLTQINEQTNER